MKTYKDFPVDESVMIVADTPKMAELAKQIDQLRSEYAKLKAREQKRAFQKFLAAVRSNAQEVYLR